MYRDFEYGSLGPDGLDAGGGRSFIATIGIDDYALWPPLGNAVRDARSIARLFTQLGFIEVSEPLLDGRATAAAIRRLVTEDLGKLTSQDSLVVFFAGHGHTYTRDAGGASVKIGYLIPVDGERPSEGVSATWLCIDDWLREVARLSPLHILVIIDACHSGVALTCRTWRGVSSPATGQYAVVQRRRSRWVITSALDDERAMDNGPVPGHSLFTGCLIEGLQGGIAQQGMHAVTDVEIANYVARRLREYPQSDQTPGFGTFDLDDQGHLVVPLLDAQLTEQGSQERAFTSASSPTMVPMAPEPFGMLDRGVPHAGCREIAESHPIEQFRDKAWRGAGIAVVPTWLLSFAISGRASTHGSEAVAVATIVTIVVVCLVFFLTLAALRAWNE